MNVSTENLPAELLAESDLFNPLDHQDQLFLSEHMFRRTFQRGEVLVRQGNPLGEIYLISSGLVSVTRTDADGTPTEVAQLGKGAMVGELSLLTGDDPNATVTALLDTEVWALSHLDFQQLLTRSIPLALSVNRALSAKLAATNQRLTPRVSAQLTALIGDRGFGSDRHLALDLAHRIAYYTREPVLLIDAYPLRQSPLRHEQAWGPPIEDLLQTPVLLSDHTRPRQNSDLQSDVRLIRYSVDEQILADPSALLTLATRLRGIYRHILFDLPDDNEALLADTLSFMDRVVVVCHRNRLHKLDTLLEQRPVAEARERGLLAVTGWPGRFRMGEVWSVEQHHGWKVGTLIEADKDQRLEGIARLARVVAKLRVGIAWGGGTARGWALAGIANALEQLNVPMDFFAGTSAGALGAAVYGLSLDYRVADEQMRSVLPYLERTTRWVLPVTISRHSLLREGWWTNLIRTFVQEASFADMLLPYAAVALDLHRGAQHVFTRGPLWKAIRASAAVPVLAPPMVVEGRAYADGGVVNAVPLDVVAEMGADILIGIDLTGRENDEGWDDDAIKPHMLSSLLRTINVAYNTSASRTLPLADVLIRPALRPAAVYDVSVMDEFMEEGKRATLAALPEFRQAMPWLA